MTGAPIIEFRHAGFAVAGRFLVRDLNLTINQGETLVLLGRSGSGKTTTLKLINCLLEPTTGVVLIHGRPTTTWDPIVLRRQIGYPTKEAGLFPHYPGQQNPALAPSTKRGPPERT